MSNRYFVPLLLATSFTWSGPRAKAEVRIKDITDVQGVRSNQLTGVGLVVGLDGSGSKSPFTQQVAVDMLQKFDITAKIVTESKLDNVFQSDNISVVMVTAKLPPFARPGSRIDVTVSALDDAESLQGGTLLLTPLRGADGRTYAVGQGPISIGGFTFSGQAASAQKNHPTTGRISNGAIVELEALGQIAHDGHIQLLVQDADFATARAVAGAINEKYPRVAFALDAGSVVLTVPHQWLGNLAEFVSEIGLLEVIPDSRARVVINERTGTVVAGERVRIDTVAIAHGNIAITTGESPQVSQPASLSQGATTVVPRTRVDVVEQEGRVRVIEPGVTVADLASALNALGVTPRDLIAIFQALKQAGALHAELIIM